MKHLIIISFITLLLCTSYSLSVDACRGPQLNKKTFFDVLLKDLYDSPIVAKVEVLQIIISSNQSNRFVVAKIIDAIKGIEEDKIIIVSSILTSCSMDQNINIGQSYYIFGSFNSIGFFEGNWPSRI